MRLLRSGRVAVVGLVLMACSDGAGVAGAGGASSEPPGDLGKADYPEGRCAWLRQEVDSFNQGISAEDRAEKYDKMAASPFSFYRGTNHLFWHDLAGDSRLERFGGPTAHAWLQGDLHAFNFGAYHNDDGQIVYDLNDFDEVVVADYQLDLWRLATSIFLIGWENGGFTDEELTSVVQDATEAYLDAMADFASNDDEVDYAVTSDNAYGRLDEFLDDVVADNERPAFLDKWTVLDSGVRVFALGSDRLEGVEAGTKEAVRAAMEDYGSTLSGGLPWDPAYFEVKDVARRLGAGTGSLGVTRYYVLIEGPSSGQNDDILLDAKCQGAPSAYPYLDPDDVADFDAMFINHAERAVLGQKALLSDVDDHLGWMDLEGCSYSIRERSPYKESFPTEELDSVTRLEKLATQWGTILAAAHARADEDFRSGFGAPSIDEEVDARTDGHHAEFRKLVAGASLSYAHRVVADYECFLDR